MHWTREKSLWAKQGRLLEEVKHGGHDPEGGHGLVVDEVEEQVRIEAGHEHAAFALMDIGWQPGQSADVEERQGEQMGLAGQRQGGHGGERGPEEAFVGEEHAAGRPMAQMA